VDWLLVQSEMEAECSMVVGPGLEGLVRMKQTDGETFHSLVKHQFGQLLSLSPQESKEVWKVRRKDRLPGRKASVGMGSSRLTEERVDIIYKVASISVKI